MKKCLKKWRKDFLLRSTVRLSSLFEESLAKKFTLPTTDSDWFRSKPSLHYSQSLVRRRRRCSPHLWDSIAIAIALTSPKSQIEAALCLSGLRQSAALYVSCRLCPAVLVHRCRVSKTKHQDLTSSSLVHHCSSLAHLGKCSSVFGSVSLALKWAKID